MAVFFVSDLHLGASRPEVNRIFFEFLRGPARKAVGNIQVLNNHFFLQGTSDYADDSGDYGKYDPNKAKQLLDQASWKAGSNGFRSKNGQVLALKKKFGFIALFHDSHHRAHTRAGEILKFHLHLMDGVLAFGESIRRIYRGRSCR